MGHYQICFEPIGLKIERADGTLLSDAAREAGVHSPLPKKISMRFSWQKLLFAQVLTR